MTTDVKTLYAGALRNTHAAEHQGLVQMKSQLGRLESYPAYKALIETHIDRVQKQIDRLEVALGEVGMGTSSVKEAVTSAAGAIGGLVHGATGDPVLKDLYAGYAYQYHQIAAYRSLGMFAKAAGFAGHAQWIDDIVRDEEKVAEQVAALVLPVTAIYLEHASR